MNAVTLSSGHCTSLEKTTPRTGRDSCYGVSKFVVCVAPAGQHMRRTPCDRIACIIGCRVEVLIGLRVRLS
jgi:hypothetical protein